MKRIAILVSVLFSCLFAVSCNKDDNGKNNADPAQLGIAVKDVEGVIVVPKSQTKTLELTVVADPKSAEAYTITLGANPGLVASYNAANGTSYQMLPAEAYSFTSTTVMLPRYGAKSTTCELRLKGEGCVLDQVYLLPVVIDGVQGGTNFTAPDEKAAYILFQMGAAAAEGAGTQDKPYLINSIDTFMLIDKLLKDDASVYFKMTEDVDFANVTFTDEEPWRPINYAADDDAVDIAEKRMVVFDGNNHKISNFTAGGAIFGVLTGSVQNLTIENADITCTIGNAGGILAGTAGTSASADNLVIKNVKVVNSKLNNDYKRTGGLVGWLKAGTVENVEVECTIVGEQQVGGIAGRVESGSIINCSASGTITAGSYYSGGLVGYAAGIDVKNSHAGVNVTHLQGNYSRAGGLIGQLEGNANIEKCYATGNVEGAGHMAGGLVGVIGGEASVVNISKSYATGNVTIPHGESGNWAHAGGLVGTLSSLGASVTISNCYATGTILARRYSSGFVGSLYEKAKAAKELKITNCYSTCDISGIMVADRCGIVLGLNDGGQGDPATVITCTGFVAWNVSERLFSYAESVPEAGNYYGTEGTVSSQADKLGWSKDIWDLSGALPSLK